MNPADTSRQNSLFAWKTRAERLMRNALVWIPFLAPVALPFASAVPAVAVNQGPYTLEVLVDGRPLGELYGNGRTYVQAIAGREYSLRLTNHTGRRVAMAVSVDGLNSIDAKTTAAKDGSKWILGPWETITLEGWQTSSNVARRFYFTTENNSYGAWLGNTDNLGVISAVVFRERVTQVPITENEEPGSDRPWLQGELRRDTPRAQPTIPQPGSAAGAAPIPAEPQSARREAAKSAPAGAADSALSDEYAATGIGRQLDHPVEHVEFDSEEKAAASLTVRYEYRNALVKLGLLPPPRPLTPLERRERARGFAEPGFAPDPYRQGGHR